MLGKKFPLKNADFYLIGFSKKGLIEDTRYANSHEIGRNAQHWSVLKPKIPRLQGLCSTLCETPTAVYLDISEFQEGHFVNMECSDFLKTNL